jgi:MYXO-CTERM domain-containing protein
MRAFVLLAVLGWPAVALANHHHIGGSGSGSGDDPNADCLVWGYTLPDGGQGDASVDGDADASTTPPPAPSDGGTIVPAGAVLVCLEHATLFGCDCGLGGAQRGRWGGAALALVGLLVARRRRRVAAKGTP